MTSVSNCRPEHSENAEIAKLSRSTSNRKARNGSLRWPVSGNLRLPRRKHFHFSLGNADAHHHEFSRPWRQSPDFANHSSVVGFGRRIGRCIAGHGIRSLAAVAIEKAALPKAVHQTPHHAVDARPERRICGLEYGPLQLRANRTLQ